MAMTGRAARLPCPDVADAVLDRLPLFADTQRTLEPLAGGYVNRTYRVHTSAGADYAARFSGLKSPLLWLDNAAEVANTRTAAALGVSPAVVAALPDESLLVVDWVEGRTLSPADLDDEAMLAKVAQLCRRLHDGPRFVSEFDLFATQRRYLAIVREQGFRMPEDYLTFADAAAAMERVLTATALPSVPCHNDLVAANMILDDERLWFIDYEYSGNGDPCFELGNLWSESALPTDRLDHLIAAYFGAPSPALAARARLFATMCQYTWTLWASIQDAIGDSDFGFWDWGLGRYALARAELSSAKLPSLLAVCRA